MTATLVYDGDCGFCTWVARLGERVLPAAVTIVPWQKTDLAALGLSAEAVRDAVQWVPDGPEGVAQPAHRAVSAQAGHRAIAAWFLASGLPWSVLGRALLVPGISWCAARIYRLISVNRHRIPGPWHRGGQRCGIG
jgi:predicted DCC family thiol-disulfide oxidoreductase YuxK